MDFTSREILIWLNSLGIGNSNIKNVVEGFSDLPEFWASDSKQIRAMKGIRDEVKEKILYNRNIDNIKSLFMNIEKQNIDIVTIFDEEYPTGLRYLNDSPQVLYIKGNNFLNNSIAIAIVGSRKATSYGKWACEKFTKELVELGVTIISGLASGIDTIAHKTTLENDGKTIAVLGNGIDNIYPKRNLSLYKEIEREGTIVTEFPLGTPPLAYNFPQRNRIISGLSKGVIIIEAQEKSGSLITAHHALDQGKDVFALPGNINSIFSGGTNKLIKDGAKPLLTMDDIIEEIYELKQMVMVNKSNKIDYSNYSETETKIIRILESGPVHTDIIAYKIGMDIQVATSLLTVLELKGAIRELSSRVFTIS
ncbi:DNA-processing protein DprA [Tissierella sp.]|uniref:DNA-processing protein DprA n=1 Tax=Tissierella sp. TaxID=41274 RepID=UPI002867AB45|nr:DNA-processing protein DprA [Tissierella sp.]MDR7856280.1 DNA-processing protein DprA [Tissierella sp.]